MAWYVISDHHFRHANIIGYCDRPFSSPDELDSTLLDRHYATVEEAQRRFEQARDSFHEIGDMDGVATHTSNLGRVAEEDGDLEAAHEYYSEARERFEQLGEAFMVARVTDFLGDIALQQGDPLTACERFETALAVFLETNAARDAVPCSRDLFETYDQLEGEHDDRIRESATRLVDVAERTGHQRIARILRNGLDEME